MHQPSNTAQGAKSCKGAKLCKGAKREAWLLYSLELIVNLFRGAKAVEETKRRGGKGAGISCMGIKSSDFLQSSRSFAKGRIAGKPQSLEKVYEQRKEAIYTVSELF